MNRTYTWQIAYDDDGRRFQMLNEESGLYIYSAASPRSNILLRPNAVLLPVQFLSRYNDDCDACTIQFADLRDAKRIASLLHSSSWKPQRSGTRIVQGPGSILHGQRFHFQVEFGQGSVLPKAIRRVTDQGNLLTETSLVYTNLTPGVILLLSASLDAYDENNQLRTEARVLLHNVAIDTSFSPGAFRIDSSKAVTVWDDDQQMFRQTQSGYVGPGPTVRRFFLRLRATAGRSAAAIQQRIGQAERVYTDDIGWKQGGQPAQLMGFFTEESAYYPIRSHHGIQEVLEVLPTDFSGTVHADRGRSYDAAEFERVKQQKCLEHVRHNLKAVIERNAGRTKSLAFGLKGLLEEGRALWYRVHDGALGVKSYLRQGRKLRRRIDHDLRDRPLRDPDNDRPPRELGRQHDRGHLVRFLQDPRLEPANNRAERLLRPAVIARKVSPHCSKKGV